MIKRLQCKAEAAKRQGGWAILLVAICLCAGLLFSATALLNVADSSRRADAQTELALTEAKAALLVYAGAWPKRDNNNSSPDPDGLLRGPGYLPCPDRTDDGAADSGSCGSASGTSSAGQAARLGRLPWLTLGLDDLRDGHGNRLWYAVSSKYKANTVNRDMGPDTALGTISIRDAQGTLIHDGSVIDAVNAQIGGVAAVIIAPGPPIARWDDAEGKARSDQIRSCSATSCDGDSKNYLERAWFQSGQEDNASFVDPNTGARKGNVDGFIRGPIRSKSGEWILNDRLVYITYEEIQSVMMRRVAQEVSKCLMAYAQASGGFLPFPAPVCKSGIGNGAELWKDQAGFRFGRLPQPPFSSSQSVNSLLSEAWPTGSLEACTLGYDFPTNWWTAWRYNVFYAVAPRYSPSGAGGSCEGTQDPTCLKVEFADGRGTVANIPFIVFVSGPPLPGQARAGSSARRVSNYLEGSNALLEQLNSHQGLGECTDLAGELPAYACTDATTCPPIASAVAGKGFNDVVHLPSKK